MSIAVLPRHAQNAIDFGNQTRTAIQRGDYIFSEYRSYSGPNYVVVDPLPFFFFSRWGLYDRGPRDEKECAVVAAIIAIVAAVMFLIHSAISASDSIDYNNRANQADIYNEIATRPLNSPERRIYHCSRTAMEEASKERARVSITQAIMGVAVLVLAVALIISVKYKAHMLVAQNLYTYGAVGFGVGLLAYAFVRLHHSLYGRAKIIENYDEISWQIARLQGFHLRQPVQVPVSNIFIQHNAPLVVNQHITNVTVQNITINYAPKDPPPGYEESQNEPALIGPTQLPSHAAPLGGNGLPLPPPPYEPVEPSAPPKHV
jgi:hypothetical protein